MSKGVLVLEWMPMNCIECPFCYEKYHEGNWCDLINEYVCRDRRLEDCPLRELPEYDYPSINPSIENCYYAQGWNDCLDEILGE